MKKILLPLIGLVMLTWGCALFAHWKAIPPPGGCEECHFKQISHDWKVTYSPPQLSDELDRNPWQRPSSVEPPQDSPLEQQKITEQRCFRCHKGPDKAHVQYKGRYHH